MNNKDLSNNDNSIKENIIINAFNSNLDFTNDIIKYDDDNPINSQEYLEPNEESGEKILYEGDFEKDIIYGKGKMTFFNGWIYEGDIDEGPHGKGVLTISDGRKFVGEFRYG